MKSGGFVNTFSIFTIDFYSRSITNFNDYSFTSNVKEKYGFNHFVEKNQQLFVK